jgi:hypothetical protein
MAIMAANDATTMAQRDRDMPTYERVPATITEREWSRTRAPDGNANAPTRRARNLAVLVSV